MPSRLATLRLIRPNYNGTIGTVEGTGLGLSITYEIVTQQHGGTITVDSEVGDFTEPSNALPSTRQMSVVGITAENICS